MIGESMTLDEMRRIAQEIVPGGHYEKPLLKNGVWRLYDPPQEISISFDMGLGSWSIPMIWNNMVGVAPEPAKREPLPVRQTTETIYGWRTWGVTRDHRLKSVTMDTIWEGPVLRADGPPNDYKPEITFLGSAPGTHGIYAYRTAKQALRQDDAVAGRIVLSGRVVRHEHGYRCEVATMDRLYLSPDSNRKGRIKALRDRYQCPVYTDWRKFARKEKNDGHR